MTLLTVDEFKARVSTDLADAVIEDLLDAAEAAIAARYGAVGAAVTELVDGGLTWITLRRRAASIDTITETYLDSAPVTLDDDDYRIRHDRRSLQRLDYGTNPSRVWTGLVEVKFTPEDDTAERKRVQAALVQLDLNYAPGLTSEQIGSWREDRQQSSVWNYETEREAILASLIPSDGLDFA